MRIHTSHRPDAVVIETAHKYLNFGPQSVSYLVDCIRADGVWFPTNHNDAADEFERLGFKLRRVYNAHGSVLRTYVEGKQP